ncbi:MAG: hypothetical protein ACJAYV_000641 [Oleispira sp.]|jgi:uncharacterized protein YjfI (DUF2170 family)
MNAKSSAHYQREYRKRLREQGLVKREVWIRPENARQLSVLEKHLRVPNAGVGSESHQKAGVSIMASNLEKWTTNSLFDALIKTELFIGNAAAIEVIDGVDPSIHIVMHDYGDLPIFVTVSGEQIIVEAVLWSISEVNDVKAFNDSILRTHKYFPLSTISLDSMSDGDDYYHMFGALSSTSILHNVVFEIEVLANNVIQATSAYSGFFSASVEA